MPLNKEERASLEQQLAADEQARFKECQEKIDAILKEYGYSYSVVFNYKQLAETIVKVIAASKKEVRLRKGVSEYHLH